jgi:hypothetical protein
MNQVIAGKIAELSFIQIIEVIGFIVICVIALLVGIAFAFDKLNVKSFSFRNGFTFYQDGETRRPRITRRRTRKTK